MTANPDFSFANMGQVDFVATFQNLSDKDPLYDATRAGVVRVALEVTTTLAPQGAAAGVQFDVPIDVAMRELVDVTDIAAQRDGTIAVKYTWQWKPTSMAEIAGARLPATCRCATAA
jgi:hypothetical protein